MKNDPLITVEEIDIGSLPTPAEIAIPDWAKPPPSGDALAAYIAAYGTPVVDEMRRWLAGESAVLGRAEFFKRFGQIYRSYRKTWSMESHGIFPFEQSTAVGRERAAFIHELGFAVPTEEALALLEEAAPLLEIGAGTGSWSALLARRGVDVIATDLCTQNYSRAYGADREETVWHGRWHPVERLQAKTAVRRYPERNVFCSWPSLGAAWLRQAAKAMRPGRRLIVVREEATASEETWDYIERAFKYSGALEIPTFYYLHDHIEIWDKKGGRSHWRDYARDEDPDEDAED